MKRLLTLLALAALLAPAAPRAVDWKDRLDYLLAPGLALDGYTVVQESNKRLDYYRDFAALNDDGTVNVVIEIPQGTNAKFEVSEQTGQMSWEIKNGKPRVVKYLGYPANYGMVPRTMGGDGDSLDGVVIGRMLLRGEVVKAKVIGVLRLVDGGVDDKIVAVLPDSDLGDVDTLAELDLRYPGITAILEAWFVNYKGPGELQSGGFGDRGEAMTVVRDAMSAYQP